MPDSSGGKLCPICDSPLQPGSKKCGFCGTDLSIFDMDFEAPAKTAEPTPAPAPKPSIQNKVEEVLSRPQASQAPMIDRPTREPAAAKPRPVIAPVTAEPETPVVEVQEEEPVKEAAPAVEHEEAEFFECPQCGARVPMSAGSCQKCGVLFAEEGAEMFQCPACNTLVNVDAQSCPGCGALFVEPEAEQPAEAAAAPEHEIAEPEPLEEAPAPPAPKAKVATKVEEPEPSEDKGGAMKSLFGRFKFGKKEEPAEAKPAPKPEPKPERPPAVERIPPRPAPAAPAVRQTAVRVIEERPAPSAAAPATAAPAAKDKGRELARMVAEMKPLLTVAREREVDIGESKDLIDDAAVAGRERQLDKAIDLVQKSKTVLMGRIDSHLAQLINKLNDDTKVAREFGGDISRATTYMQELARARFAKDVEAAFVYVDKVDKELLPITGRYNEARKKVAGMKLLIADCEVFIVDTKEARRLLVEANKALEAKDFDKLDGIVKSANDSLFKSIPARMNEELQRAKDELIEAKSNGVNITPMLTVLKSATSLMKSGNYAQAIREMREFKKMMKKPV